MTNTTDPNERARELKPCPFCGGEATISWKGNIHSTRSVVVKCSGCRYERKDSALRYGDDWLLNVAVTAWNRRALSRAEDLQRTVTELCAENAQLKMEVHKRATTVEGYVTVPKTLTTDMLEAGEQELAMGNDFADAWEAAIDTMLGVPSFTSPPAPAAVAGGEARVTDGMVDAYLAAQAKAVQAVDDKWGAGGKAASYLHPVREACRAGLEAALAAALKEEK